MQEETRWTQEETTLDTQGEKTRGTDEEERQGLPDVCLLLAVVGSKKEKELVQKVLEWSVEEGFELIEWSPSHDGSHGCSHEGEEEEVGGTARLAEALQAYTWPEMTMRSKTSSEQHPPLSAESTDAPEFYNSTEEKMLAEGLDPAQDPDGESFEQLFAKFADMKGIID